MIRIADGLNRYLLFFSSRRPRQTLFAGAVTLDKQARRAGQKFIYFSPLQLPKKSPTMAAEIHFQEVPYDPLQ